jgi:hypothetical protein
MLAKYYAIVADAIAATDGYVAKVMGEGVGNFVLAPQLTALLP